MIKNLFVEEFYSLVCSEAEAAAMTILSSLLTCKCAFSAMKRNEKATRKEFQAKCQQKTNTNLLKSTKSGRQRSAAGKEILVKLLNSAGSHVNCSSIQS